MELPGQRSPVSHTDFDGAFEDTNGNRRIDFGDVVAVFASLDWIAANEPVVWFDNNRSGRKDFDDVVMLFFSL